MQPLSCLRKIVDLVYCSLIRAEATSGYNATYFEHLSKNIDIGRTRGIDAAIQEHDLDALVLPQTLFSSQPAGRCILFRNCLACL